MPDRLPRSGYWQADTLGTINTTMDCLATVDVLVNTAAELVEIVSSILLGHALYRAPHVVC